MALEVFLRSPGIRGYTHGLAYTCSTLVHACVRSARRGLLYRGHKEETEDPLNVAQLQSTMRPRWLVHLGFKRGRYAHIPFGGLGKVKTIAFLKHESVLFRDTPGFHYRHIRQGVK